ncbi:hypothetical protein ACJ5NV_02800 [Loktanella agnita]|uniref:hypothetical protein n=1 Tax=Loktanella agnita TaxID=287097 RepID=UPI003986B482
MGKNAPKHREHNAHGSGKKPFGQRPDKDALLDRMKKAQGVDKSQDRPSDPADDMDVDEAGGKPMRDLEKRRG